MSERREDTAFSIGTKDLFRQSDVCKKLKQLGDIALQSTRETNVLLAGGVFAVSYCGALCLLVSLIPSRVALCCICIIFGALSSVYIIYSMSRNYVRRYGLVSLLPDKTRLPLRQLLLEKSCADIIFNSYSEDFGKISDFIVSLTLPMTKKERKRVFRHLPKHVQQSLRRTGLIHMLPRAVQMLLFPEVLFKRSLPDSSESSEQELLDRRPSLLTVENVAQHNRNHSRDGSAEREVPSNQLIPIRQRHRAASIYSASAMSEAQDNAT